MSENDKVRMTNDELEQALAGIAPTAPEIDRDALMYQAGYAAARGLASQQRTIRFWQSSTALLAAASVALAFTVWQRPTTEPVVKVVEAPPSSPTPEAIAEADVPAAENQPVVQPAVLPTIDPLLLADPSKNYLALRAVVLRRGVDAWPVERHTLPTTSPHATPTRPSTVRGMMEELLPPPSKPERTKNENLNEASTNREEPVV